MKPTKEILRLIDARMKHAEKMNDYDGRVRRWLQDKGIDSNELEGENGCMITTEPYVYAELTIKLIEEKSEDC